MASMKPGFTFTGPLGNLSAYKMRGSDKIIIRTKGGPTREQIRHKECFDLTRRINREFGGRSRACRYINHMMHPQKQLADYNFAGPMNALLKPIQELDTVSEYGERNIYITKNPQLLEGFSLNLHNGLESIIRSPLHVSLSKDDGKAQVSITELVPGLNFFVPGKYPLYSIVAVLGIVPDIVFTQGNYQPAMVLDKFSRNDSHTEWYSVLKGSPATTLDLQVSTAASPDTYSLMLTVGIRFGTMEDAQTIKQIKYAGAARIMAMK